MGRKRKLPLSDTEDEVGSGSDGEGQRKARRGPATRSTAGLVSTFFLPPAAGSGQTLADLLRLAPGEEEKLAGLLQQLPPKHAAERAALRAQHHRQLGRCWLQWRAGNSLLFYGFGSKYDLLETLQREKTRDGASVSVNGLQAGVTAKQVLMWTVGALKQARPQAYRSYSADELLELIATEARRRRVYVIIHNLDGPGGLGDRKSVV